MRRSRNIGSLSSPGPLTSLWKWPTAVAPSGGPTYRQGSDAHTQVLGRQSSARGQSIMWRDWPRSRQHGRPWRWRWPCPQLSLNVSRCRHCTRQVSHMPPDGAHPTSPRCRWSTLTPYGGGESQHAGLMDCGVKIWCQARGPWPPCPTERSSAGDRPPAPLFLGCCEVNLA